MKYGKMDFGMEYTSNRPTTKNARKAILMGALVLLFAGMFALNCAKHDDDIPVYETTTQRLHDGSLYYATSGCLDCHGTAWDGKADATPPELKVDHYAVANRAAGVQLYKSASLKSDKRGLIARGGKVGFPVERGKSVVSMDGLQGKWLRIVHPKCKENKGTSDKCWLFSGHLKLNVADFTLMTNPNKTPLDYFKTITAGSVFNKTLKDKKYKGHDFHGLTDRARWAMANFLFSLAPLPQGRDAQVRAQAVNTALQSAANEYAKAAKQGHRRWQIGYTPNSQRAKVPALDDLLKKGGRVQTEASFIPAPAGRIGAVAATGGRSAAVYQANCAACHGKYAAGEPGGLRFGLAKCKGVADNAKESRQCPSYFSATDLRGKATAGRFKAAHRGSNNQILSGYYNLTDGDIAGIMAYINKIATK